MIGKKCQGGYSTVIHCLSRNHSILMAFFGSAQVFADSTKTYVSKVKVDLGGSAESDLKNESFTTPCNEDGDSIDLNQGVGGGKYSQGKKRF